MILTLKIISLILISFHRIILRQEYEQTNAETSCNDKIFNHNFLQNSRKEKIPCNKSKFYYSKSSIMLSSRKLIIIKLATIKSDIELLSTDPLNLRMKIIHH